VTQEQLESEVTFSRSATDTKYRPFDRKLSGKTNYHRCTGAAKRIKTNGKRGSFRKPTADENSRSSTIAHAGPCRKLSGQGRAHLRVGNLFRSILIHYAARLGSPLVVGVGDGENFIASDASPLVGHTQRLSIWPITNARRYRRFAAVIHRRSRASETPMRALETEAADVD